MSVCLFVCLCVPPPLCHSETELNGELWLKSTFQNCKTKKLFLFEELGDILSFEIVFVFGVVFNSVYSTTFIALGILVC